MKKNIQYSILLLLIVLPAALWQLARHDIIPQQAFTPEQPLTSSILLVPLDSRPPCRQFVMDAGRIAGMTVLTPPSKIQDYYSQPGDTAAMQQWVLQTIGQSQAAILSIDQLLYGGLLAAREKHKTAAEVQDVLNFLRQLHASHPDIPLYAFSILPRQTPQDTIDGYQEKKDLLAYSRLKGRQAEGLPADENEIARLEKTIPADNLKRYLAHFAENEQLNKELIHLVQEGVLAYLVLGQDDGEPYSIPNIEKQHLRHAIETEPAGKNTVFLTHGADEIALSLLARIQNQRTDFHPRIKVYYNSPDAPDRIMPYMAVSTQETVREKIALLGGKETSSENDADFALVVSACSSEEDDASSRLPTIRLLQSLQNKKIPAGLVDLSRHFSAQETVLPLLLEQDYPVNQLIAYAGWNTTSNAIGTAIAQSSIYEAARRSAQDLPAMTGIAAANLTFLQNRILEDYFYLKEDIDVINQSLKKAGYTNTADLDLAHNYRWANQMLQQMMKEHVNTYKNTRSVRQPVRITSPAGDFTLTLRDMTADLSYPWPRTFEIWLQTTLFWTVPAEP